MSMKNLNTFCTEKILDLSSNYDVCTFAKAFPEHQDAVNAVWTHRPEINVDDALLRDAAKLIEVVKRHKKLKRVTFIRLREYFFFYKLSAAIASNCSQLEDLNIPGLDLSSYDVTLLSTCNSLKRMNIKYAADAIKFVEHFVANNPWLESIRLKCMSAEGCITNNLFENLPETIREVEIISDSGRPVNYRGFWSRVHIWRLEKLKIDVKLSELYILILSRQTTLKYLNICFEDVGNSIELLFRNNPGLEEVILRSSSTISGACLKYLPPTLKNLKCLMGPWILDDDAFVECLRTWKLNSLSLYLNDNINLIIRALKAAPSLSDIYINIWDTLPEQNLTDLEQLAQLRVLHLSYISVEQNNWLNTLLENCVNLQKLKLEQEVFDRNLCSVIAALPKLKEFSLGCETYENIDYVRILQDLSRSTSLTTVEFNCDFGLSETDILMIIKYCKTFTKLVLKLPFQLRITEIFLMDIVQEIKNQSDRTNVLNLEIMCIPVYFQDITTTNLHPMLNMELTVCDIYR